MRKFIYTTLLVCVSLISVKGQEAAFAFKKDDVSGDAYYEEVVQLDNVKQADIYKRAKTWIIANFKTEDNNINFDEKEYQMVNATALKVDEKKH